MKELALAKQHEFLGARMVEFAGYCMPIQYTGVIDEHLAVRNSAGIFDVSHMGEFIIKGPHALDLIQKISSNDASLLYDGKVQYSCMPNDRGGIVDDLLVYRIDELTYMLVVNASNIEKDRLWIEKHNSYEDTRLIDISDKTCLMAVQGPKATAILQPLTGIPLGDMKYYTFKKGVFNGVSNVLISATGYTGAGGFEIYAENDSAEKLWTGILKSGELSGIKPAGLACRDTLRLEMGFCLYGNDIDDTTSPIEAGLGWITKFSKEFINSSALQKQKREGVARKLSGFKMTEKGIPRKGYQILSAKGDYVGVVTSGTMSPSLGRPIGMGYIRTELAEEGADLCIAIREKTLKAKVVRLPFYGRN